MLTNKLKWQRFEQKLIAQEHLSHQQALRIYEALYKEAVSLGVINSKNILDGLEVDIRIARALNSLS